MVTRGLVQVLSLLLLVLTVSEAQQNCPASTSNCASYKNIGQTQTTKSDANNHYYIGGLFGVHDRVRNAYECDSAPIREEAIINMEAFHWAIRQYGNSTLVSVGGVSMDTCSRPEQGLENILSFEICKVRFGDTFPVSPRNLLAYVGSDTNMEAKATSMLLNDMNKTLVSHAASSQELADDKKYPYFLRTVPSDNHDPAIIAELIKKFGTKYVMGVYQDNDYGEKGFMELKEKLMADNVCVVYHSKMSSMSTADEREKIAKEILERKSVKFVVVYTDAANARLLMQALQTENAFDIQSLIFLGTSAWADNVNVVTGLNVIAYTTSQAVPSVSQVSTDVTRFYNDLDAMTHGANTWNPWFKPFWDMKCPGCQASTTLQGKYSRSANVPYTILAVKAVIEGVRSASVLHCGLYDLCPKLLNNVYRGQNLYSEISATKYFKNRELADDYVDYKINSYDPTDEYRVVGTYKPKTKLVSSSIPQNIVSDCHKDPCTVCGETTPAPQTTSVASTSKPVVTTVDPTEGGKYAFIKFLSTQHFTGVYAEQARVHDSDRTRFVIGQKWIIALGVLAGLGVLAVVVFEIYILFKLMGTSVGRQWRTMWLGQLLLLGIFLAYLTLFAFLFIPTKATCGITRFGIGMSYAIIYAVLLVKLMVVLTSKTSDSMIPGDVESPNYLKGIYQFLMFIFAVGVQAVIDIQWLIQVPPEAVKVVTNSGEEAWICNHYTWSAEFGWRNMNNFVRTEFDNHLLALVYIMFLILVTTIVAIKAHGIITNHRESVFIGIVSGFSIPIWISWGLVGSLNKEDDSAHQFGDACLAFGLFMCATLALFAMFLPKVRQLVNMGVEGIYLEDDRDTIYAGSVIMAPPSYKSRPSSVIYANSGGGIYSDPVILGNGDPNAIHLKHHGTPSTYSAPALYSKRSDTIGSSKVLRVTGDLTGKLPNKPVSEAGYYSSSHYRKARSEGGGTLRGTVSKARSMENIGSL